MACGTVSQDVVRSRLAELLAQADLNTISERMLVARLCSDLGDAVKTEHRQIIKVRSSSTLHSHCISHHLALSI